MALYCILCVCGIPVQGFSTGVLVNVVCIERFNGGCGSCHVTLKERCGCGFL